MLFAWGFTDPLQDAFTGPLSTLLESHKEHLLCYPANPAIVDTDVDLSD